MQQQGQGRQRRHAVHEYSESSEYSQYTSTVLEDQPDYDHLAQWKKSLDEGRSAPVIFTVIFFAI